MQILVAAAVICGVVLMSSCEKEPLLPEVIESEVYDNGSAEEVTVTSTSDGPIIKLRIVDDGQRRDKRRF